MCAYIHYLSKSSTAIITTFVVVSQHRQTNQKLLLADAALYPLIIAYFFIAGQLTAITARGPRL
jgi:hypothetical protein